MSALAADCELQSIPSPVCQRQAGAVDLLTLDSRDSGDVFFNPDHRLEDLIWISRANSKIDAMNCRQMNWDSYGARPIDPSSIAYAKKYLRVLVAPSIRLRPRITASGDGNVAFCWDSSTIELDAEIRPDGSIAYLYESASDAPKAIERVTRDVHEIFDLLARS